ncbi:branched-chain amino acid aminotransferase [Novosphingobium bradum]|uniref:Branched-chain-amino-acid aminotransferase n=1 Tax=Novosphingobium bradum TaxID=1737444 RepID=A0ABV7IP73_9SPHN
MATIAESPMTFTRLAHPAPVPVETRDQLLADPGFGKLFSDHMVTIDWSEEAGWHNAQVGPLAPLPLHPAAAVLHYAQEIFEGLKAYRLADGAMALFRPGANAARFNASARRLAMPELPEALFVEACRQMVAVDGGWFPSVDGGSLYLRPFMIATEAFLGVRPAKSYKFIVIASPAGNYFKSGAPAVSIWVSHYSRAAPGGTGAAKCGGNYAASLVPQAEAMEHGHDQVVFLDAEQHRWIEELGGMNLYFAFADGTLLTPPLSGTILPGITRDSLLTLAREEGLTVREERYSIDQWREDAASGRLVETFACGTAAVVTPVGRVTDPVKGEFVIGSGGPGQLTQKLRARLVAIQRGEAPDPHGWVMRLD